MSRLGKFMLASTGLVAMAAVAAPVVAPHATKVITAAITGSPPAPDVSGHGASVPFELFRGNRVIVAGKINGHSTETLLDTGASVTVVDLAYARSIGFPKGTAIQAQGAGGAVDAELVSGVSLEIGGMRFDDMTVAVMDLSKVAAGVGRPMNVVVGRELFNSTALEFDWANGRIRFTPSAAYRAPGDATVLPLERDGPFNFVTVGVSGNKPIRALLDLGHGGNLILPSDYWSKVPALASLRYADAKGGGVGGMKPVRVVTLPSVEFAGSRFNDVPAVLGGDSQGNQPQYGANVGIGFLKQFDVTLDLGRDRLVLKPLANRPAFSRDRAGAQVDYDGKALKVIQVARQGPAAAAGLKVGDTIVAIDRVDVGADFYRGPSREWNRRPAGERVALTLADGRNLDLMLANYF